METDIIARFDGEYEFLSNFYYTIFMRDYGINRNSD